MLSSEQFEAASVEFKDLIKQEFGIEMADEESTTQTKNILMLLTVAQDE